MPKSPPKILLVLDNDDRAERLFNTAARKMGLPWTATSKELGSVTQDELETASHIVALTSAEREPLLYERFPSRAASIECWSVASGADAAAVIEREVMNLIARLLGGRPSEVVPDDSQAPTTAPKPKPATVRVGRETKGRRGKGVTTVSDLPLDGDALRELATLLKGRCGTGGTVKEGRIEIQGDQRDRLTVELEKLGYRVKRVGG